MSQSWLKPNWEPGLCLPSIPLTHFQEKGIKAIILDVDGTLLHGKKIDLHDSVKSWVTKANHQLSLHLLSNNPSKKRVGAVASQLNLAFTFGAAKPSKNSLIPILNEFKVSPNKIAIIGDRVFTDVLVGNRLGLYTVLVKPLGKDGNPNQNDMVQRLEKVVANLIGAIRV